jgi:hypothetical protein
MAFSRNASNTIQRHRINFGATVYPWHSQRHLFLIFVIVMASDRLPGRQMTVRLDLRYWMRHDHNMYRSSAGGYSRIVDSVGSVMMQQTAQTKKKMFARFTKIVQRVQRMK